MLTESRKKANKKWDKENMITLSCKVRKEIAENLRNYADSQGLTIGIFARRAMQYCKNNNINLQQEPEEENSEK
nr:MAG TPA_asm: Alginate and motility regulator [Caudoviricetes sp.]